MTKEEFVKIFRENPETIISALHAIKSVADEMNDSCVDAHEKFKWHSILFHAIKMHGFTVLMFKNAQEKFKSQ